ncbi:hypothetical protein [Candidatus Uabimicrobium sp. HlEnr_7]|uniref:hypothetical protein n=1 Tax=Candidatus Uabimicrobium helgolandensis TaxID=3095367 RepID=UPI0035570D34
MSGSSGKWKWEVLIKLLTSLGFLATIFYGYYEYKLHEETREKERKFEEKQSFQHRQFELYKTFWEKRFEIYVETCNSAATVSTFMAKLSASSNIKPLLANKPKSGFWKLYYGALSIVEDKHVEVALFEFGQTLRKCEKRIKNNQPPIVEDATLLKKQSLELGLACRESIREYWKTLEDVDRVKMSEFTTDSK